MKLAAELVEYMAERERIRVKKEAGEPRPWTDDLALQQFRFTNIKREYDYTTRHFKKNYYDPHYTAPAEQILLNCSIFRWFGHTDYVDAIGWQKKFNPDKLKAAAYKRKEQGLPVFTSAYVITNQGIKGSKIDVVVDVMLAALWERMGDLAPLFQNSTTWQEPTQALQTVTGFGGTGFMAKEVVQDVMLTGLLPSPSDRRTWCPVGPGARRGLNGVYGRPTRTNINSAQGLKEMQEVLNFYDEYTDNGMPDVEMPVLDLHDIQFNLCEFSKLLSIRATGKAKRKYVPRDVEAGSMKPPNKKRKGTFF